MTTDVTTDDLVLLREWRRRKAEDAAPASTWATPINRETGRPYAPHHEAERRFVHEDAPRRMLAKGGEGGGKSVAGIVKTLGRLARGMSGIMGSPDFEHLKRSLWPEFARWCPWQHVIPEQRYRARAGWEPTKPFTLTFDTGATLLVGGFDEPGAWEGPNVSFAHFDEARRHKTAAMLKVLDGRCRIPGPNGEPPQLWLTTTPRKHWLYEYFGPWDGDGDDPFGPFKSESLVIDLYTADNEAAGNLYAGYTDRRRQSLTEAEARVLLEAAWEDIDEVDTFLPSIALWDACRAELPPLGPHEPCILVLDAAESNDTFGSLIISASPLAPALPAVRYVRGYKPRPGVPLDFDAIEQDIVDLVSRFAVQEIVYDPMLLGQTMRRLKARGVPTVLSPFPQGAQRLEADKGALDAISARRVQHGGEAELRAHLANANRKIDSEGRRLRIVKRTYAEKIDLAVCLSMGLARWVARPHLVGADLVGFV